MYHHINHTNSLSCINETLFKKNLDSVGTKGVMIFTLNMNVLLI